MRPGAATIEAAVVHYFASRVRGDRAFEEVLPPADQRKRRLRKNLATHDTWKFLRFRLVRRKAATNESGKVWVNVYFEMKFGEKKDGGTDEVGVRKVGERWVVVLVPT